MKIKPGILCVQIYFDLIYSKKSNITTINYYDNLKALFSFFFNIYLLS